MTRTEQEVVATFAGELPEQDLGGQIPKDEVVAYYRFTRRLVNLLDATGMRYRGHTFKYDVPLCLLIVKTANKEGGYVCFINALSYGGAIKTFFTKLDEGTVEWRKDKFYGN